MDKNYLGKYLRYFVGVFLVILVLGIFLAPLKHRINTGSAEFLIKQGQTLNDIAESLEERELIFNRLFFIWYTILTGHEKDFKAGRYILPGRASIRDLVKIFSEGRSEPEDIVVTIPEGTNAADIDKILTKAGLINEGEFLAEALGEEGYLFPDTYRFNGSQISKSQTRALNSLSARPSTYRVSALVRKMKENFDNKTQEIFRDLDIIRKRSAVVTASMLEKEVQTEEDMRLVAGIIEKRLKLGMPLQVDATVQYGVCLPVWLGGRYCDVSQANIVDNLKKNTEYNTYVRVGLPRGPISNPGLVALRAALNPEPSDFLYYLSARDGTTIFSKTAAEHERNRKIHINRN